MSGVKVLLWHVHGSWTTAFVAGTHEYLVPVLPDRSADGLGRARTWDWPASAREVTPDAAARRARRRRRAAAHARPGAGARVARPRARPRPARRLPRAQRARRRRARHRHPLADRDDIPIVHVTHFNRLFCDNGRAPTTVIEHGIARPGGALHRRAGRAPPSSSTSRCAAGRYVGADLLPGLAAAAPVDVFGMGLTGLHERYGLDPDRVALHEDLPQAQMHAELARRRVYVHPVRWTSLGLSLLEAMHLGMPVVALAATEVVEAVPAGAGVLSTRPERLLGRRPALPARRGRRPARRQGRPRGRARALRASPVPLRLGCAPGRGDAMRIDLVSRARQPARRPRRRRRRRAERARRRARRRRWPRGATR